LYTSFSARALGLDLTALESIEIAAQAGFEGVDLLIRDVLESGVDLGELKARMSVHGLRGGAFPLPVDWREDAERFARGLDQLPRFAEAAARLGLYRSATRVMAETPDPPRSDEDPSTLLARVFDLHVERLSAIAQVLRQNGQRLGLEVIGVESFRPGVGLAFLHKLHDLDPLLRALDSASPGVTGVLVDGFHLYAAGESAETALLWGAERIVWVHVADLAPGSSPDRKQMRDEERGLPGEHGAIDSRGLLKMLNDAGYSGPVTVEPLARCRSLAGKTPLQAAQAASAALRSIWPGSPAGD
jgi:sugar phosphate isomerase/epimerase